VLRLHAVDTLAGTLQVAGWQCVIDQVFVLVLEALQMRAAFRWAFHPRIREAVRRPLYALRLSSRSDAL
jgi:hypothetical protein